MRIKREEAKKIVHKNDGKCSTKYIDEFCQYIGISEEKFFRISE